MAKEREALDQYGNKFDLYFFDNPMMHEDWHEAEQNGLVLIATPEYWDDTWLFSKPDDKDRAEWWYNT